MGSWRIGVFLLVLLLAPLAHGQTVDFRACAWGMTTCAGGGGGGGAVVSPKFAQFHVDRAAAVLQADTIADNAPVLFESAAVVFIEDYDPTNDFDWDDTGECFAYSGSDGTFEVTAALTIKVAGSSNQVEVIVGTGLGSIDLDSQNMVHERVIDLVDMDCLSFYGQCTLGTGSLCDPYIESGIVTIKQVAGVGGSITGTPMTTEYIANHTASSAEIENGVLFFDCPGACTLTLPMMGPGKTIQVVNIPNQTLFILPVISQLIETTDVPGDRVSNASVDEDKITLVGKPDGGIAIFGKQGSWPDAD